MNHIRLSDGSSLKIRPAEPQDTSIILDCIRGLAEFEKLTHEMVASEERLRRTLFGPRAYAEVLIALHDDRPAAFALFFHNYSTFLAKPGIYLEDLFVKPEARGLGIGEHLLTHLAQIAEQRECGRLEWSVLDWNERAIKFYENLGARRVAGWSVFRVTGEALKTLANRGLTSL